jgi:hypothetical protein
MKKSNIGVLLLLIAVIIGGLLWEVGKVIAVWKWIFS